MKEISSDKIAVIGGSGRTGRQVVNQLIQSGYHIRLLMRYPEKLKINNERIEIIPGDARDKKSVRSLLEGCTSVISTLGQPKGEKPIFSTSTQNILTAMNEYNIRRYIAVAGIAVDAPNDRKDISCRIRSFILKLSFHRIMSDRQKELEILTESDVDWTLVRVPLIIDAPASGKIRISLERPSGKKISSTDLADFLIKQISDMNYIKKCPFITND